MMYKKMKRCFDVIFSFLLILLLTPGLLLIALLIKVNSKGPIFFKQNRIGKNGHLFSIFKFRTMLTINNSYKPSGEPMENYSRVTKVGSLLRTFSLDELPQLINVLSGSMSLVGPRPALPYQVHNYTKTQKKRLNVKPGITGLAQVNGRNKLSWEEKINYDLLYIEKMGLFLDIKILLKTMVVVFKKENVEFVKHDEISHHEGSFFDDIK